MSYKQFNLSGVVNKKPKNVVTEEQREKKKLKDEAHMAFKKFKASGWSDRLLSDREKQLVRNVYGF